MNIIADMYVILILDIEFCPRIALEMTLYYGSRLACVIHAQGGQWCDIPMHDNHQVMYNYVSIYMMYNNAQYIVCGYNGQL